MAFSLEQFRHQLEVVRHKGVLPGTVIEVDWASVPPESLSQSPLQLAAAGLQKPLTLRQTVSALDRASRDDRIAGLVARVQPTLVPLSVLQELREAVLAFRAAGKRTTAWAEAFPGNGSIYLASAFDRVMLQPAGSVGLVGVAATASFLGETLPWIGLQPDFARRHEYKSAVDIFTQTGFTEPHREATERLMQSQLEQLVTGIAEGRGLAVERVRALADAGPHEAEDALAAGLVDALAFRDQVYAEARGAEGSLLYLSRFAKRTRPKGMRKLPSVAVVPVTGAIAPGRNGVKPGLPPGPGTGSDTATAALRDAVADPKIKAIVLRVDSPGGAVGASEAIWREVHQAREAGTPVVASMGAVAASGGYYVAMGADRIVASAGTITGSIGVFSGKFVTAGLRQRLHLATEVLRVNPNADMYGGHAPFTPAQRSKLDASLDKVYDTFTTRVAAARGLSPDAIDAVARGRVWTGADAVERGLVDVLGGFSVALREAKVMAGLAADAPVAIATFPKAGALDRFRPKE
ncbi:MAG: signal peptide peptidase SppA, partial [Acidimicrobiales bacterium]